MTVFFQKKIDIFTFCLDNKKKKIFHSDISAKLWNVFFGAASLRRCGSFYGIQKISGAPFLQDDLFFSILEQRGKIMDSKIQELILQLSKTHHLPEAGVCLSDSRMRRRSFCICCAARRTFAPANLRNRCLCTRSDRDQQYLPQRLSVLRYPAQQQNVCKIPSFTAGDSGML